MEEPSFFYPNDKKLVYPYVQEDEEAFSWSEDSLTQIKYDEYFRKVSRVKGFRPLSFNEWSKLLNLRGF